MTLGGGGDGDVKKRQRFRAIFMVIRGYFHGHPGLLLVLGSRLTNNLSGQRQPLTSREQAGLDRRGVGGEVLGSRLTNNLSGQRQPLTPREQAGLDRRGVGVGGL
ncbi:hypothetical protein V6N11_010718 [Hibiscus sabdariffa]|uniref:Uncharacterized protein n=1 Tax=Hibiscus sabdariffa TaxID=183260 RepID=A0ABR2S642_9ROSI